jgi:hypothetical protein
LSRRGRASCSSSAGRGLRRGRRARGRSRDSPGELLVILGDIAEDVNASPPGPGVPLVPLLVQGGDGEPVVLAGARPCLAALGPAGVAPAIESGGGTEGW